MDDKKVLKNASILVAVVMVLSSVSTMATSDDHPVLSLAGTNTDYIPQVQHPETFNEHWLHFDDGENYNAIGISWGGTLEAGIRITPDELGEYNEWKLIAVKFYHFVNPGTSETHSGTIKIYDAGTSNSAGPLITTELFSVTGEGWFEIPLSNLVTLNASKDVWVAVEITHGSREYPIGVDRGRAVDGKGDWIYINGAWEELQYDGLDNNWNIWAKITGGEDNEPPITRCELEGDMEGGIFVSDVTVTLNAIDYISGVDYIKYKLDDSEWNTYDEPFDVAKNGEHTICFYSVDNEGNVEEEKTCTFIIDQQLSIEITISGGFGVNIHFKNTGGKPVTGLKYNVTFDGGLILIPLGRTTSGTVDIPFGDEASKRVFVFGFGNSYITVTANDFEETETGFIFLFFALGI